MRIIYVSSEVAPFSKSGGLADVAAALPAAIARRGHEVLVATPRYGSTDISSFDLRRRRSKLSISIKGKLIQGGLLEGINPEGIPVLFVDQPGYFERDGLYGSQGKDYDDNDERFTFFCRAVLEACRLMGFTPDVIHCNDWQTGPLPALLSHEYRDRPELNQTGSVFTVHNMSYQGLFAPESMMTIGLPWDLFTPSSLELGGRVSFLKAGLVFADALTTVSRRYAEEIKTPAFGHGLEDVVNDRAAELKAVPNGVDYSIWDPPHDNYIAARYSPTDLSGKSVCKRDLQQRLGLAQIPELPLVGSVCRLTAQKGLDLFLDAATEFLQLGCQWVFHGTGDSAIEEALRKLAAAHPEKIAAPVGYQEEMAHRIQAASDLFLMPSRFEPSGLNQLYALRYGTIPVVHAVGGLDDTIDDISEGDGNGFKFSAASSSALLATMRRALDLFANHEAWQRQVLFAMGQDFSWDMPARRYEAVYRDVTALRKTQGA